MQTVLSVLYSPASKVTFGVGLSHESLTWNEMHPIKGEAPVFTFMKCACLLSLQWNIHCFSKSIQMGNPLPVSPVESPDVYIVERLFSSSLVVVVSLSMPRRMNVYHFKKGTEICNYSYSNNILSVRLNRQVRTGDLSISEVVAPALFTVIYRSYFVPAKRLVVCLEESVYIHNIKDMKLLKTLLNTPTNPSGIMRMTSVFRMSDLFILL